MVVPTKYTRGNLNSPLCHSTLATTRRALSLLGGTMTQQSSYRITGRFDGLPTGLT